MSVTLEMPDETLNSYAPRASEIIGDDAYGTAETAADLLEQGEAEAAGPDDGDFDPDINNSLPLSDRADEPEEEKPAKKKRTRKVKAVTTDTPPAEQLTESQPVDVQASESQPATEVRPADPPVVAASPAKPSRCSEIARVEAECVQCFMAIAEAEGVIESAKGTLKFQREVMAALAVELRDLRNGEMWQPKLPIVADPPAAAELTAPPPLPPVPADFYPDAWRNASIDELKLPPKLADKLIEDGRDTIGRLEDLRAEISQGRAKWPKGIGAAKITAIEDAVITWLTANRDSQAFGEATQSAAPSDTATEPTADEADAALIARAASLNDGTPNCLENTMPTDKAWQSGYNQYGRVIDGIEQQLTDCPYIPGDEQDDWLRGFMAARADYPEATTTGETTVTSDLDEI